LVDARLAARLIRFLEVDMSDTANSKPEKRHSQQHRPPAKAPPLAGLPEDVAEFIGERPIVRGENPQDYDALFTRIEAYIKPADPVEWIWVKNIVDATWEARRFRRMRDQVLDLGRFSAMKRIVETLRQDKRFDADFKKSTTDLVFSWIRGSAEGEAEMAKFLGQYGLEPSAIMAETFMSRSDVYDQLERLAGAADKRRDSVLREIERRRAGRAQQFRDAASVVDAEVEDVGPRRATAPQLSGGSTDDKRASTHS
jgi:hypothetical protein